MNTPLDDLRKTLLLARMSHEGWRLLDGPHRARAAIVEVRDRYRGFFATVQEAFFTTFVVKLASVFGKREDEITLYSLPGISDDPEFNDIWCRGRQFHKYRSKAVAHRDHAALLNDPAKDTDFTYDDLKALLDDTCDCYDRIARKHELRTILAVSCESDFIQLVHDLTHGESI